jgi:hypothetical protein
LTNLSSLTRRPSGYPMALSGRRMQQRTPPWTARLATL